ncbi:MAG: hypothetical protein AVDCRST_MAG10-2328, partial [uncultured Acidimicrobiales bacterium]
GRPHCKCRLARGSVRGKRHRVGGDQRAVHRGRRDLGGPHRGVGREDEPGGAARGRPLGLLLHGPLQRAEHAGPSPDPPRGPGHLHVRARQRGHHHGPRRHRRGPRGRRGRLPRGPRRGHRLLPGVQRPPGQRRHPGRRHARL